MSLFVPFTIATLMQFSLKECWVISGRHNETTVVPVHDLVNHFGSGLVDILPAVHALTGCDTTSKVSTKSRALKTAITCGDLIKSFGKDEINDQMISDAEQFLVKCVSSSKSHFPTSFDELGYEIYI